MAFKARNLRQIGDNTTNGVVPTLFMYYNEAGDTVTAAGYIPTGYNVKDKDQVLVVAANGQKAEFHYASVAAGIITLTKQA